MDPEPEPKIKKIFEPSSTKETLRGWRLHAHKGRDRHDEAARHYDKYHNRLGGFAIFLSAIVGSSFFASLGKQVAPLVGIFLGIIGIISAGLVSIQTFYNYAGRAEQHRITGVKYKIIIRELEQELAKQDENIDAKWLEDIRKRLDKLETEAPVVPESIYKLIEDGYDDGVCFVKKVEELPSQQCPDRL